VSEPNETVIIQLAPILLKPAEAARVLAIGERTLWELKEAGEIPVVNVGKGEKREAVRYLVEDLLAWARKQRPGISENPQTDADNGEPGHKIST
jgi:helix-turn-helix protein